MIRFSAALLACALLVPTAQAVTVTIGDSTAAHVGFMNVFELPANGGGFVFPSGWGVPDLTITFDDPNNTGTFSPNTIGDPDPFWYIGGGGPGAPGNKIMEANFFQEALGGVYSGQTVTFEGEILSDTTTAAHDAFIFIRDFAPDFSSFNETKVPVTVGPFSIDLAIDPAPGRNVQWGLQMVGENVWVTDVAPFGSVVFATGTAAAIPEPSTMLLVGAGLLGFVGTRRRS